MQEEVSPIFKLIFRRKKKYQQLTLIADRVLFTFRAAALCSSSPQAAESILATMHFGLAFGGNL